MANFKCDVLDAHPFLLSGPANPPGINSRNPWRFANQMESALDNTGCFKMTDIRTHIENFLANLEFNTPDDALLAVLQECDEFFKTTPWAANHSDDALIMEKDAVIYRLVGSQHLSSNLINIRKKTEVKAYDTLQVPAVSGLPAPAYVMLFFVIIPA